MGPEPWILGLGGSHNGSACLLHGSELVVAVQEERLSGVKRDWLWAAESTLSVSYCLEAAGITADDLDAIAVSGLPSAQLERHDVTRNSGDVARRAPSSRSATTSRTPRARSPRARSPSRGRAGRRPTDG